MSGAPRAKKARKLCEACSLSPAVLVRPKTGKRICKACFFKEFEAEIHHTIVANGLFSPGDRVAIAASGGKDSTVLAHVMTKLNREHGYGLDLFLLSVDEGITGYRDDSLETVKRNQQQYEVPLVVVSYKDLYGWTMDDIVASIGLNSNCTFCGVFRRQALDRGAALAKADKVVTGHNADDVAETVLMNILRGDIARLGRCTNIVTGAGGFMPRSKPFKYVYEKEIVMYAYFHKLDYFSTECIYSPNAYRGYAREFLKDIERVRPAAILDIIHAAEHMKVAEGGAGAAPAQVQHACVKCGYMSSQPVCQACVLMRGLNAGTARVALTSAARRSDMVADIAREAETASQQATELPDSRVAVLITGPDSAADVMASGSAQWDAVGGVDILAAPRTAAASSDMSW
ncbi:ctu1 [Symbiodinium sp. KB8]|nr:ctu1 [Symbiodinium sp. KB8]